MNDLSAEAKHGQLKWYAWIIGFLLLAYSSFSAYDYIMSFLQREAYYSDSGMTEFQIAYFTNFPIWVTIAWTLSVWGLLFATISLFLRFRIAFMFFLISLIGTLEYVLYAFGLSEGQEAMGAIWPAPIVIAIVTAAVLFYYKKLFRNKV